MKIDNNEQRGDGIYTGEDSGTSLLNDVSRSSQITCFPWRRISDNMFPLDGGSRITYPADLSVSDNIQFGSHVISFSSDRVCTERSHFPSDP